MLPCQFSIHLWWVWATHTYMYMSWGPSQKQSSGWLIGSRDGTLVFWKKRNHKLQSLLQREAVLSVEHVGVLVSARRQPLKNELGSLEMLLSSRLYLPVFGLFSMDQVNPPPRISKSLCSLFYPLPGRESKLVNDGARQQKQQGDLRPYRLSGQAYWSDEWEGKWLPRNAEGWNDPRKGYGLATQWCPREGNRLRDMIQS